jgi:hypothetical protein
MKKNIFKLCQLIAFIVFNSCSNPPEAVVQKKPTSNEAFLHMKSVFQIIGPVHNNMHLLTKKLVEIIKEQRSEKVQSGSTLFRQSDSLWIELQAVTQKAQSSLKGLTYFPDFRDLKQGAIDDLAEFQQLIALELKEFYEGIREPRTEVRDNKMRGLLDQIHKKVFSSDLLLGSTANNFVNKYEFSQAQIDQLDLNSAFYSDITEDDLKLIATPIPEGYYKSISK